MIRSIHDGEIDTVADIWLLASINAHPFIPETFWRDNLDDMRNLYLPNCRIWVYQQQSKVIGFISYFEGNLPAIFIHPDYQSRGVGKQLVAFLQNHYKSLNLTVYKKNPKAIAFYQRMGFVQKQEQCCSHTGEPELIMVWERA